MDISIIANIADVLAAIGVIGSLLFLAVQVQKNTQSLRIQTQEVRFDRVATVHSRALEPGVASVIDKGRQRFNELSPSENIIFNAWASEYIGYTNSLIFVEDEGLLTPTIAVQIDRRINWFFKHAGARDWWTYEDRHPFPMRFETILDAKIASCWPENPYPQGGVETGDQSQSPS